MSWTQANTVFVVLVVFGYFQKSSLLPATAQENGVAVLCRSDGAVLVVSKLTSAVLVTLELEIEVEVEVEAVVKSEEVDKASDP